MVQTKDTCQPAEDKVTKYDSYLHLFEVLSHGGVIKFVLYCDTKKGFRSTQENTV